MLNLKKCDIRLFRTSTAEIFKLEILFKTEFSNLFDVL